MQILVIVLLMIIGVMAVVLLAYQRQIRDICRQLSFLEKKDSNMLVTTSFPAKSITELARKLNVFLNIRKKERKAYLRKEKNISDIYTNISHDIRTPLTSLDGYFQLLEQAENEEEQKRYAGIIQERIGSLKDMLEELFEYTKLENTSYQLELTDCCVNRVLKNTVFSYYEEWEKMGICAQFDITDEPLYINGNEQALRRIIQNIIKNALVHGKERICITLHSHQEEIELKISNEVENAEQIDVERVFERFYKAEKARSRNSTGLGLSIAGELAVRMNGRIEASVEKNMFCISIYFVKKCDS